MMSKVRRKKNKGVPDNRAFLQELEKPEKKD